MSGTTFAISELIARDVELKPEGDGWRGRCPFHVDGLLGLHVSDAQGTFMCFSCGRAGNAVRWLMDRHGLSAEDAIARLLDDGASTPD